MLVDWPAVQCAEVLSRKRQSRAAGSVFRQQILRTTAGASRPSQPARYRTLHFASQQGSCSFHPLFLIQNISCIWHMRTVRVGWMPNRVQLTPLSAPLALSRSPDKFNKLKYKKFQSVYLSVWGGPTPEMSTVLAAIGKATLSSDGPQWKCIGWIPWLLFPKGKR